MSSVTIFDQEKTERAESGNNRPLCIPLLSPVQKSSSFFVGQAASGGIPI
jgi:hypothetical protein